jgi:hypothetical protein
MPAVTERISVTPQAGKGPQWGTPIPAIFMTGGAPQGHVQLCYPDCARRAAKQIGAENS